MADNGITHTIGRRKEAVCRVYVKPGSGKWDVNGRTLGDYFPRRGSPDRWPPARNADRG